MAVLLILIAFVAVFGTGVLLVSRRRGRGLELEPPAPTATPRLDTRREPPGAVIVEERPVDDTVIEDAVVAEPEIEVEVEPEIEVEPEPEIEAEPEVLEPEVFEKPRFRDRLGRARAAFAGAFGSVRSRSGITEDTWEDLEDALISADVGVALTGELLDKLRGQVKATGVKDPEALLELLKADLVDQLGGYDRELAFEPVEGSPNVWLFVGVNGVGKTTTIGKVGAQQRVLGRSVVMAAGDTFRAAAAEQLGMWADRSGAELVRGSEGGDPSSVIFDGVQRAAARGADLVLADTAGRLHNKSNLMDELRKVRRVAGREPGRVTEVLLVLDATTGQNGLAQAREFTDAVDLTGVVLTKLDGSAKGGIVLAIQRELKIPVKLVGLGEQIGDLVEFDPQEFVDALFA